MSFWDPYDRYHRRRIIEQQRRAQEEAARRAREQEARRAQAEQEATRQVPPLPPQLIARFEQELAQARRERDEWEDRHRQAQERLAQAQQALAQEREQFAADVEAQREQLRAEAESQRERLLRNAEQRAFEENRKTLSRLLDVADNFERLLAQAGETNQAVLEGARLTYRDFRRALEQAGVQRLESVGQPFDPALHEAVASQPSEADEGTVLQELSPGYQYRGALLRPARVVVAGNGGEG